MISGTGKITGKGQVQVPKEIREAIGARVGDELLFELLPDGSLLVRLRKKPRLSELAGVLKPRIPFQGVEEEEETMKWTITRRMKEAERE